MLHITGPPILPGTDAHQSILLTKGQWHGKHFHDMASSCIVALFCSLIDRGRAPGYINKDNWQHIHMNIGYRTKLTLKQRK